jgi:hypothetical protein
MPHATRHKNDKPQFFLHHTNGQSQKIKKQEIKGNFENVFAPSICSISMGLLNDS